MKDEVEREKFFKDFEERFGTQVSDIEMINIEAGEKTFKELNLKPQNNTNSLWGLLVFCENKKTYFYAHPSESMMSAMIRVAKHGELPEEQCVCLSDLKDFTILDYKKSWYDFFIPGKKFMIEARFTAGQEALYFLMNTQKKADQVKVKF